MVDVGTIMEENYKGKTSIIGKLHADCTISKEIIQNSMMKIWRTSKPFSVLESKPNIFLSFFNSDEDMQWVMSRSPWLFETSLLSLKEFDGYTPVSRMDFSIEAFWVNMHEFPNGCMNVKMGNHIGSSIGVVKECDVNVDGTGWGITLRVLLNWSYKNPSQEADSLMWTETDTGFP